MNSGAGVTIVRLGDNREVVKTIANPASEPANVSLHFTNATSPSLRPAFRSQHKTSCTKSIELVETAKGELIIARGRPLTVAV